MGQCSAGQDRQWGGRKPQEGEVCTDGPFRDSLLEELGLEVLGRWARIRGGKSSVYWGEPEQRPPGGRKLVSNAP